MKVVKGIASVYLVLLVVLQPVLPFIEFAVFQDYIAENLCINRFEENSCCKGKCFLEEKVNEANTPLPQPESKTLKVKSEPLLLTLNAYSSQANQAPNSNNISANYSNLYTYHFHFSVFHPPQSSFYSPIS